MFTLQRRMYLVLLVAALIALFSGLVVRGMILKDLKQYLSAERTDVVRLVAAEQDAHMISTIGNTMLIWSILMACGILSSVLLISRTMEKQNETTAHASTRSSRKVLDVAARAMSDGGPVGDTHMLTSTPIESEPSETDIEEPLSADDDLLQIPGDADRIAKIVKGLDDLAKAEALGHSMQKEVFDVEAHLKKNMDTARASVIGKDLSFNLECGPGLMLTADPRCLDGIMANLLDNAVKAVKKEGSITVRAAQEGDFVVIKVADTGTGIRKKNIPHLFERFYRGSGNGIGLGLTIVQALVIACKGTIDVRSSWGEGSTFTVRIPAA